MVLGNQVSIVSRAGFVLVGAVLGGAIAYVAIGFLGHWYEMNVAKSDDDLSKAYVIYLIVLVAGALLGAWLGGRVSRRT